MRAGNLYHRVDFYAKAIDRDDYGASTDTWPTKTIETRGELRWTGGAMILSNDERMYAKNMELTVRYNPNIVETMKVQLDDKNDLYLITYMETLGRYEGLRLSIEKCNDGLDPTPTLPPTGFTATYTSGTEVNLAWTNNASGDAVSLERSLNGNEFDVIHRTATGVTGYLDENLGWETKYYYRARAFVYYNYSSYTAVDDITTSASG